MAPPTDLRTRPEHHAAVEDLRDLPSLPYPTGAAVRASDDDVDGVVVGLRAATATALGILAAVHLGNGAARAVTGPAWLSIALLGTAAACLALAVGFLMAPLHRARVLEPAAVALSLSILGAQIAATTFGLPGMEPTPLIGSMHLAIAAEVAVVAATAVGWTRHSMDLPSAGGAGQQASSSPEA